MRIYIVTEVLTDDGIHLKDEVTPFANEETAMRYFRKVVEKDRKDSIENGWTEFFDDGCLYESWKEEGRYMQSHSRIQFHEVELNEDKIYKVQVPYHTYVEVEVEAKDSAEARRLACQEASKKNYEEEILSNLVEFGEYDVSEVK